MQFLVSALGAEFGAPCALTALACNGSVRWTLGDPAAAAQTLPLDRLGRQLGRLHVPAAADRQPLQRLLPTAAALLLLDADADAGAKPPMSEHVALLHAALAGADTFVWEWDIDSDWLSDIDEGLALLGYASHAIGHTKAAWNSLIHPDDRAANHAAYERHACGEVDIHEHTYRARAADGRWRWLHERGRVVERHADGRPRRMLGTQTDITERRARDAAASDAMERQTRITQHVPGMWYEFRLAPDTAPSFPYVSQRCLDLFGLAPGELERDATALFDLVLPQAQAHLWRSVGASARDLTRWRLEFPVRRRDGAERWMRGDASPQRQNDGVTLWHGYIEDVTERRELERAREEAAAAAAANRAKTEFLSRMSHELRTPLNAVLGFTQLIEIDQAEPPSEGQKRRLRLIREAGAHLLQMIGDLLDLTRIESGGMALQFEAVSLRAVAEDALAMLRNNADKLQVVLRLADGSDAVANADRTRVRQVLLNLLSNAIKYNRPGGLVEVRVLRVDANEVVLSVRDTGVGISEAELPQLFEPFYRGPQARTTIEGAGIGLSVTQALVALMGGRIAVCSKPGQGSTFNVTLRAAPA